MDKGVRIGLQKILHISRLMLTCTLSTKFRTNFCSVTEKTELATIYFEEESPSSSHVAPEAPRAWRRWRFQPRMRMRAIGAGTGSGVDRKIRGLARRGGVRLRPSSSEGKNNDNDGLTKRLKCTLASGWEEKRKGRRHV